MLLVLVSVFAQHKAASKGPAPFHGTPQTHTPQQTFSDKPGHPTVPHVDGKTWVGHDTGRDDANYHLDHPGSTAVSRAASAPAMYGVSAAVVPRASGLTDGTGALRHTMSLTVTAGYGIQTTSSFTTIRITSAGISHITCAWESVCM